ncbi:MAG: SIMPL domain-containing protein [Chromatiales bacterium]|jgi:hypothetical protein|nr:SIMPL domain-containing protein [Chromatiales bacterium]
MPVTIEKGSPSRAAAVLGLTISAGLVLAGVALGHAVGELRGAQRVVSVKGLAEREVMADLAIWPIVFSSSADTLLNLDEQIQAQQGVIREFLAERGFPPDAMSTSVPRLTDFEIHRPGSPLPPEGRYLAETTLTLRSRHVAALKAAMQESGELVRRGIPLVHSYESGLRFLFTSLAAIKPAMIAEATRDARKAAQQFAQDSDSRVGAIRRARQGYFSIADREGFGPEHKTIRVVTHVDYFLVD